MQTKMLGCCLGGWLLIGSLALAQTPATPPPPAPAPVPAARPAATVDGGFAPRALSPEDDTTDGRDAPIVWCGADALVWWIRQGPLPVALLTMNNGNPVPSLANAGTEVLFGNGSKNGLDFGAMAGFRVTSGGWFDPERILGLDGTFFMLPTQKITYNTASPGSGAPTVGVPFNAVAFLFANPAAPFGPTAVSFDPFPATFQVTAKSQFYGGDVNFVYSLLQDDFGCWQFLIGYCNMNLRESLNLNIDVSDPAVGGSAITVSDSFSTKNDFNGLQLGTRVCVVYCRFLFSGTFKVALGDMASSVNINGSTTFGNNSVGLATGTNPGGIFSQPSNIGSYKVTTATVIPQFQFQTCYTITKHISCSAGVDLVYISSVLRPGNQINADIDPNQSALLFNLGGFGLPPLSPGVAGPIQPLVPLKKSDFVAGGLSLGLEFRY